MPKETKRTKRSKANERKWRAILREQRSSGLNQTAYCKANGISSNSFFWWKSEIKRRDEGKLDDRAADSETKGSDLVPVRVTAPLGQSIELVLWKGRVVRVPPGFDAGTLKRLVATLEDGAGE